MAEFEAYLSALRRHLEKQHPTLIRKDLENTPDLRAYVEVFDHIAAHKPGMKFSQLHDHSVLTLPRTSK